MIPLAGLPPLVALRIVDSTRDDQVAVLRTQAEHARAIEAFRDRGGVPATADAFVADHEVYAFAMRAFDLEDQIFGKGMMRKVLASDADDPASLVNRLSDPRFRRIHAALGLGPGGPPSLASASARERIVDLYVDRQFAKGIEADSPALAAALAFRAAAPTIRTAFDILRDPDLSAVVRTAVGLPAASAGIDIDVQAAEIERRLDLKSLSDPAAVERIVRKHLVLSSVLAGSAQAANGPALLLSGAQSDGLLELAATASSRRGGYRAS